MEDVRIILSASWVALMLTYLLGDVLRIYSGDFAAGKIGGIQITGNQWLGVAILLVTPIVMVFLSLTLSYPLIRWANIIIAIVFPASISTELPTTPPPSNKSLLFSGLVLNVRTVGNGWK